MILTGSNPPTPTIEVIMSNLKITDKLLDVGLDQKQKIIIRLQESCTVFHSSDDYSQVAYNKTNFVQKVTDLITQKDIRKSNSLLNSLRDNDLLYDYERGLLKFPEYVYDKLNDNRSDYLSESLEAWDYKRGELTLSCDVEVPVYILIEAEKSGFVLDGHWSVYVPTDFGTLEIKRD